MTARFILLVEDDEAHAQLALRALERTEQLDVETVQTIAQARTALAARHVDLVLARHTRVAKEDTVVVGDWLNDVPMLRAAGRSYAMGQAPAQVKEVATNVLSSRPRASMARRCRNSWPGSHSSS